MGHRREKGGGAPGTDGQLGLCPRRYVRMNLVESTLTLQSQTPISGRSKSPRQRVSDSSSAPVPLLDKMSSM
jgi:hypothetical protein